MPQGFPRFRRDEASETKRKRAARRLGPAPERLEGRTLLSLTFQSVEGLGVTGTGFVDIQSNAVAEDVQGNSFVTGSFLGTANFAPSPATANLTNSGGRDPFVAKYAKSGALVWAEHLKGSDSSAVAQGSAIAVDGAGDVYLAGTFTGTFNFDPGTGNTSITANGNDIFVEKLDPNGNLVWVQDVPTTTLSYDAPYGLALDGAGNAYVSGSFQDQAEFGDTTLTAGGGFDAFVARFDGSTGDVDWAGGTAGTGNSSAIFKGVAIDGSGNVLLTGYYAGTVDLDPTGGVATSSSNGGTQDIVVEKLDGGTGALSWAETIGGSDVDMGNAVAGDAAGNIYVTGTFSGPVDFDPGQGVATLTSVGYNDAFLMKLSPAGAPSWAEDLAGTTATSSGNGLGLALDGGGQVLVSGDFLGGIALDPSGQAPGTTAVGSFDAYVAEYDDGTGGYLGGQAVGGTNLDVANGVAADAAGDVVVTGSYAGPANFAGTSLPEVGKHSFFLARWTIPAALPPPSAPSTPVLEAGSDTGASHSDDITAATTLVLDVNTAGAANTVELVRDGVVVGTRTGPGSITDPGPVHAGIHNYTAIQVDPSNQSSPPSAEMSVNVVTTLPPAPAVPALLASDDSGALGDGITNVRQPHLIGHATAGTTIQIVAGGVALGASAVGSDGSYSVPFAGPLGDGTYSVQVRAVDVAGNVGAMSPVFTLTIKATLPTTLTAPTLLASDDSGTVGDDITDVRQPRLTGTAAAGTTVQILAGGAVLGAGTVGSDGHYTVALAGPLADGTYGLSARAVDVAGNVGLSSAALNLTILTKPPAAPSIPALAAADDSGTPGDGITNVRQPHLTGTATAGTTVQLVAGTAVLGSATAGANGAFSVPVAGPLADGTYSIQARAVDAAGNVGPAGAALGLTIKTAAPPAPAAPTLLAADDSGTPGDGITSVRQPRLTGTATAETTVQVVAGSTVLGSTAVGGNGTYTVAVASPLADGIYAVTARAIDVAGNLGAASGPFTLDIDGTPPATPAAPTLAQADDTGALGDGITSVRQPHLVGHATAGTTIQIVAGSNVLGAAAVGSDGSYSVPFASPLNVGTYSVQVQAVDAAGNVGGASPAFRLTIQNPTPATPSAPTLLAADDSGAVGDDITDVRQPHLAGKVTPGANVLILVGGNQLGAGTAASDGTYAVPFASPLGDGTYSVGVQVVVGGSPSASSPSLTLTIDATPPPAPSAPSLAAADDSGTLGDDITDVRQPRLTGTAAAGTTVQILAGGAVLGAAPVGSDGHYAVALAGPLADGTYGLSARALDVAGNVGPAGPALSLTILTRPPAAPSAPALAAADDSGNLGDGITNVRQPHLTGTATAGTTVQLVAGSAVLSSATAGANGAFSVPVAGPLADGTYSIQARAVDAAGNVGPAGAALGLTIKTAAPPAPAAPTLLAADDSGTPGDGITSVRQPHLTGVGVAGTAIQVLNASGSAVGSTLVSPNGTYTVTFLGYGGDGQYVLYARAIDPAGNVGGLSPAFSVTILTTAPTAPTPALSPADDTGAPGDGMTAVRQPHLVGKTVPGDSVDLLDSSGDVLATATASATDGSVSVPLPANPGGGAIPLRFRVRDVAGNQGSPGAAFNLDIVTTIDDFDGDGKSDLGLFRPSTAQWLVQPSGGGAFMSSGFGAGGLADIPVPADYDGVGHAEQAIFRPSTGQWFISGPNGQRVVSFGAENLFDIPVPGDYDGVGHAEFAVFRPSTAQWLIQGPNGLRVVSFGAENLFDIPVPGDYDGVGHAEFAVFRPSTAQWLIQGPSGFRVVSFGAANLFDIPVPGDYDGTGHAEPAVFRPSTAQWFILGPNGGRAVSFGGENLFDYPLEAPIGSLKKLGEAGTISIASASSRSAADRVAANPAGAADAPAAIEDASKPAPTSSTPRPQPARRPVADVVHAAALDQLAADRIALARRSAHRRPAAPRHGDPPR